MMSASRGLCGPVGLQVGLLPSRPGACEAGVPSRNHCPTQGLAKRSRGAERVAHLRLSRGLSGVSSKALADPPPKPAPAQDQRCRQRWRHARQDQVPGPWHWIAGRVPVNRAEPGSCSCPPAISAWPEGCPRLACLSFSSMGLAPASTVCWNGFHMRQTVLLQALSSADLYSKHVKL